MSLTPAIVSQVASLLGRQPRGLEDIAVAGPVVGRDGAGYRMLYSAIGTRWGHYSIAEAVSADGYHWDRGGPGST